MSVLTKQAIIDCTISLAETKPIKKITINDITKGCGITRNTFYYYFHDIYDVLDQTIAQELDKLKGATAETYDQIMFDIIEFAVMYKKVWRNLYKAVGQEELQKYVMTRLHEIIVNYIKMQDIDGTVSEIDLALISAFYEEALFGVLTRWIRGEAASTREEMHAVSQRIRILFDGCLELMLENSKKCN